MAGPSEGRLSHQRGETRWPDRQRVGLASSVEREIAGLPWTRPCTPSPPFCSALVANDHDQRFSVPLQPLSRSAAPDTPSFWSGSHGADATVKAAERVSLFNSFNAELSPKRCGEDRDPRRWRQRETLPNVTLPPPQSLVH